MAAGPPTRRPFPSPPPAAAAVVTEDVCAACDFGAEASNQCKRVMEWKWRGEMFPATREETEAIRSQLGGETFGGVAFRDLPLVEQEEALKARLKTYCQTVYKHVKDTVEVTRQATICQRENPFYVQASRGGGET